jgi:hypothetical protein
LKPRITRRRFLQATAGGAALAALGGTLGCDPDPSARATAAQARGERPWPFRSRPDLKPPVVEVTVKAHDTAPGYIFVAPQEGDTGQGGSMILDDRGQVVWFRPLPGKYGRAMNFEVQSYRGEPVLTWVDTSGEYVIVDHTYREIARFGAANGYRGDHHEFLISPQDTALITIYNAVRRDLFSVGGPKNGVVVQGIVQELDIATGKVLFEWHSLEHVGIEESYGKPGQDADYPGLDYFHINSIDVDHDDNLLISARKTFAIYKVDRESGEVIWRLGGKRSDFEMGEGTRFAYQHDARRQKDGTLTIFDNGMTLFPDGMPKTIEESRGIVLDLDERKMKASLVREYTHPDGLRADAAGNAQVLPNGNMFVGWGRALYYSEFDHGGKLLFDAILPEGSRSYRAFRFPWKGYPKYTPAIAAESGQDDEVIIYASWNGATEVDTWQVLAGESPRKLQELASTPREGFETVVTVKTTDPYVGVRAVDASGKVLGSSRAIKPQKSA